MDGVHSASAVPPEAPGCSESWTRTEQNHAEPACPQVRCFALWLCLEEQRAGFRAWGPEETVLLAAVTPSHLLTVPFPPWSPLPGPCMQAFSSVLPERRVL